MTLTALIKKGGLSRATTVTPATIATLEADTLAAVATVATVAVAEGTEPSVKNVQVGTVPASELLLDEESSIRAWLVHIEETDLAIITELLNKCRNDLDARRYFLQRSEEALEPAATNNHIICFDCVHYKRIDHPHLGHCAKGEPEAIAGLWDSDRRYCEQFLLMPEQDSNGCSSQIRAKAKVKFP